MKSNFKNNTVLLLVFSLVLALSVALLANSTKQTIHHNLNQFVGQSAVDTFFYYLTYLGDGRIAVIILLLVLAYNVRLGIAATLSFLTAGAVSNILKYFFFDDVNRPSFYFNFYTDYKLRLVPGTDIHLHNSFPSGHATQAFALFLLFALVSKKLGSKLAWLSLAVLTAFSRMYLSQHWLPDVIAGTLIGSCFSLVMYYVFVVKNKLPKLNAPAYQLKNAAR